MDDNNDLDLLDTITVAGTQDPLPRPGEANPMDGALDAQGLETIDQLKVDFSRLEAQSDSVQTVQNAIESIKHKGAIGALEAESLSRFTGALKDRHGSQLIFTKTPSQVNFAKALESAGAEHIVMRSKLTEAVGALAAKSVPVVRARLDTAKEQYDQALLAFTSARGDFVERFGDGSMWWAVARNIPTLDAIFTREAVYAGDDLPEDSPLAFITPMLRPARLSAALANILSCRSAIVCADRHGVPVINLFHPTWADYLLLFSGVDFSGLEEEFLSKNA